MSETTDTDNNTNKNETVNNEAADAEVSKTVTISEAELAKIVDREVSKKLNATLNNEQKLGYADEVVSKVNAEKSKAENLKTEYQTNSLLQKTSQEVLVKIQEMTPNNKGVVDKILYEVDKIEFNNPFQKDVTKTLAVAKATKQNYQPYLTLSGRKKIDSFLNKNELSLEELRALEEIVTDAHQQYLEKVKYTEAKNLHNGKVEDTIKVVKQKQIDKMWGRVSNG